MRWLKHTVSILLILAAVAVALATAFSNHKSDYGKVPLPQGGVVHLPEGKVVVFFSQVGGSSGDQVSIPVTFRVTPAVGGAPVPLTSDNGTQVAGADAPSETIGELGAVAKLDVPSTGSYVVTASDNLQPGTSSLEFGTNAGAAVLSKWRLLAGLVLGAILVSLIPVPRSKKRRRDELPPSEWSSDPRAPYAG